MFSVITYNTSYGKCCVFKYQSILIFIIDDTIKNNLKLANKNATDKDIEQACECSGLRVYICQWRYTDRKNQKENPDNNALEHILHQAAI